MMAQGVVLNMVTIWKGRGMSLGLNERFIQVLPLPPEDWSAVAQR